MNYEEIQSEIAEAEQRLVARSNFVRSCATILLSRLKSDEVGIPESELTLQPLGIDIEDESGCNPHGLPVSEDPIGFRVRLSSRARGSRMRVVAAADWKFEISGDSVAASLTDETATIPGELARPEQASFVDALVEATTARFGETIRALGTGTLANREIGFQSTSG